MATGNFLNLSVTHAYTMLKLTFFPIYITFLALPYLRWGISIWLLCLAWLLEKCSQAIAPADTSTRSDMQRVRHPHCRAGSDSTIPAAVSGPPLAQSAVMGPRRPGDTLAILYSSPDIFDGLRRLTERCILVQQVLWILCFEIVTQDLSLCYQLVITN
jgi:hypothetical protein